MAKILLIDDDSLVRYSLREGLEAAGHTVFEAADGEFALDFLVDNPVDVAIVDMIMPRRDGVETIIQITREHPGIAVIGCIRNFDFLSLAEEFGARAVLKKPFTIQQLLETVSGVGMAGG